MIRLDAFPSILQVNLSDADSERVQVALRAAGFWTPKVSLAPSLEHACELLQIDGFDLVVLAAASGEFEACEALVRDHPETGFTLLAEQDSAPEGEVGRNWRIIAPGELGSTRLTEVLQELLDCEQAESQARLFRQSVEAASNGILMVDARVEDLPIIYVNPAFTRITGYPPGEVYGRNCRFLQGGDRKQAGVDQLRHGLRSGEEVHARLRNYRRDGSVFWNDLFVSPVLDDNGQISHYVGILNDISAQMTAEDALAHSTNHDVLTGLPNFALLKDRLYQAFHAARRHRQGLALTVINIDGFKGINATQGVENADWVLTEVARRIKALLHEGDTLARASADEFMVLQADAVNAQEVLPLLDEVLEQLSKPFHIEEKELYLTASAGIAWSDGSNENATDLLRYASLALRSAKQSGGNAYCWFNEAMNAELSRSMRLRNELQGALDHGGLALYYQPIMEARTGRMVATEALVRWHHPEEGLLQPLEFLSIAENWGLMAPMTAWVLAQACMDNKRLIDRHGENLRVSVNISPLHFRRGDLLRSVRVALEASSLPPECLELELMESAFLEFDDAVRDILDALKQLGVGLVIDDFGAGYSSLRYLKQIPVSRIKIDKSFVRQIVRDSADAAISRGIIAMAHKLNLEVVGEGVEDQYQAAFLTRNHCDLLQGFYFARPMPFSDLQAFQDRGAEQDSAEKKGTVEDGYEGRNLLILDDEANILRSIKRLLRRDGYRIHLAETAEDALRVLAMHEIQVVLSDQRMPEMNGTEFLSRVKDMYPETIRIVLSGYTDIDSVTDAINRGSIYKFLTKPWDDEQLREQIRQAFLHYDATCQTGAEE